MKKQILFLVIMFLAATGTWAATITVGPGGPPTYNYATIQAAVTAASAGDIISIAPGTYLESNILVNKTLTIQGIGLTRDDVIIAPAAYDGNVDNAFASSAQNGFIIKAHNVLIRKLTIDGNGNAALTIHGNNFRAGIVTLDDSQPGGGAWNNLHVDNVFIKNVWRRGISVFPRTVFGTFIENSRVENVAYNQGLYLAGHSQVVNNVVKHCFQGIVLNPDATTPAGLFKINENTVTEIGNFAGCYAYPNGQPRAIQFDPVDPTFRTVEIKNNTINDAGSIGNIGTVGIYTRRVSSTSLIENNSITLTSGTTHASGTQAVGMLLGWSYTHGFMTRINNVSVTGYGIGILIFGSGSAATPMVLEGNVLTSSGSLHSVSGDGTGVYVANQYLFYAANKTACNVILQNRNSITGFARGMDVEKIVTSTEPITLVAHNNIIKNNGTGVDATTLTANIDVTNNYWGGTTPDPSTGPYNAVLNPLGTGNPATSFTSFIPYWCDEAMTSKCAPGGAPYVIMNLTTGIRYSSVQLALALSEAVSGETLFINGTADATNVNIAGKTVNITGTGTVGGSVISGASSITGGTLVISDIEFTTSTNNPTILVNGGNLTLRRCTIFETSAGNQPGLKVTGGVVDAGTSASYGYNKFRVNGTGSAIENNLSLIPANTWYAIGNDWGNPSGPTVSTNPGGTGGTILTSVLSGVDYVIYRPWGGITMSGSFTYYNLLNTPLTNGLTVKLYQDGLQVGADYNVTAGTYSFPNLVMGDYEVRTTSTKPTSGSVNATDAAQVNYWGPHPYTIEKVRFYAGDVTGETYYINATDALRIQKNFVYGTEFDRPNWTFWEAGKTISTNSSPTESYPVISIVNGSNKTANMYGLCTGDFNRSYTPSLKSANSNLSLTYGITKQVGANEEFDLPVKIVNASTIGAVSVIMTFPSELVNILDVVMNSTSGQLDWHVTGNELRIGWNTQLPISLNALDNLFTLKLKTTAAFTKGNSISLVLASDPLNELADDHFDVISNAVLIVDVVEASANGMIEPGISGSISLRNYPNPFNQQSNLVYSLPGSGNVTLEIRNVFGEKITTLVNEFQAAGDHACQLNSTLLSAGIYTATVKLSNSSGETVRTIKIVCVK